MTGERTYPVLPCADLDDALEFYSALGFTVTFEQHRPYACAVVELDDIAIHLFAMDGFEPATSYGSAIITVAEPGERHEAFKAGLRERFGKVPIKGIPRLLPPRRKAGTATGFSVVDVGGNWLRFYRHGSSEDDPAERRSGLLRVIDVAARQGDSRGDEAQAIAVLDAGLARHPDAPPIEVFEALLYRAELQARTGANATPDLAAARALLAEHQLGAEAERALALAVEAELTTEQQYEKGQSGEDASGSNENHSPSG
jgi:catechol 2,3-dioxygenase-like lactoylglutathione lyase family enzyme